MDYGDSTRLSLGTLPTYTGTKEEDRPKFLRDFALLCENFRRQHAASIRKRLRSVQGAGLSDEQKQTLRDTPPEWQTLWDIVPTCLDGKDSSAHSWWCENYESGGIVASNMDRASIFSSLGLKVVEASEATPDPIVHRPLGFGTEDLSDDDEEEDPKFLEKTKRKWTVICFKALNKSKVVVGRPKKTAFEKERKRKKEKM
ncbi:hypothetical protein CYMTET_56045 [Cymbomonas tetramitiformis]|uniref:Uncharacterized protein n=1 Tax=Cymbomonas tetramitiformis TaxID=36881 RepID=A0AAE0BCY6_9CHLO|nr:hypothetical protein CYMTET_56045 [Cymbomonas tetramitiformis]